VQFEDKPRPADLTTLKLRYSLEATESELTTVKSLREDIRAAFLAAAREALAEAVKDKAEGAFVKALSSRLGPVDEALDKLSAFKTEDGKTTAAAQAMEDLGLTRDAQGTLVLSSAGIAKIPDLAEARTNAENWIKHEADARKDVEAAKITACGAVQLQGNSLDLAKALAACLSEFTAALDERIAAFEKTPVYAEAYKDPPFKKAWDEFKVARDEIKKVDLAPETLKEGGRPGENPLAMAMSTVDSKHQKVVEARQQAQAELSASNPRNIPSYHGALWSFYRLRIQMSGQAAYEKFAATIKLTEVTLTQEQQGSLLLERSQQRRYWDFATGAVYVTELDDVVLPLFLAYCPFGCLRHGENILEEPAKFLSIDIGTRAGVLDNVVDERQSQRPALLVGASANPFYFLRLSAGMFAFENAQTEAWNRDFYIGGTINVIHFAEMIGPLGIDPGAMKVAEEKKE
jgi:hypothetical protein